MLSTATCFNIRFNSRFTIQKFCFQLWTPGYLGVGKSDGSDVFLAVVRVVDAKGLLGKMMETWGPWGQIRDGEGHHLDVGQNGRPRGPQMLV